MKTINPERIARDIVVMGASVGGIHAVRKVLAKLPASLRAVVGVVIHRGAQTPVSDWSSTLGKLSGMRVCEPASGESLRNGVVYVAPSDQHMTFKDGNIILDQGPKEHYTRPSVDRLFTSCAHAYGSRVLGIVLTGGGSDGANGLIQISAGNGITLVQSMDEAEDSWMPFNAVVRDHVSAELDIDALGDIIPELVSGRAVTV